MKLTGKVALVSGAGGGIGRAICLAFAEAEAALACCDIDAVSAEETARLARDAGGRAVAQPCDVSVQAQTEAAAAAAHQAFGRVDILVSGAAPHDPSGTVLETSLADWDRVLAVNLTGLVSVEPRGAALHDRGRWRLDRLYRVTAWSRRQRRPRGLLCDERRAHSARQGHGDRSRRTKHSGQHAFPGRGGDAENLAALR